MLAPEPLLTVREAAAWLHLCTKSVYTMANAGHLPHIRIGGGRLRFRRSEIEAWLDRRAEVKSA